VSTITEKPVSGTVVCFMWKRAKPMSIYFYAGTQHTSGDMQSWWQRTDGNGNRGSRHSWHFNKNPIDPIPWGCNNKALLLLD